MRSDILKIVNQILIEKKTQHPCHATFIEILKRSEMKRSEVRKYLKELIEKDVIVYGHTLNDYYFKIKELN